MLNQIWTEHQMDPDQTPLFLDLKRLWVWFDYKKDEVWVAHYYPEEGMSASEEAKNEILQSLKWSRWAYHSGVHSLQITPVFQDLPIVISSEFPVHISPGAKTQFFCRIPIWMRIGFKGQQYILDEIPTMKLSKTWFGTPLEGELCYSASTKARRSLEGVDPQPYLVNCPIWITNKAAEDLSFENFCLRVSRLDIYQVGDELWAGETLIMHQGGDVHSDIHMSRKLPPYAGEGKLISPARNPIQEGLSLRTFTKIFKDSIFSID